MTDEVSEPTPDPIADPLPAADSAPPETPPSVPPTSTPSPVSESSPPPSPADKFLQHMRDWREGLAKANASRTLKRDLRLEKLLQMAAAKGGRIENHQVQKAFRCTQLTAYRYLKALEKQGKLKRTGNHNTPNYELIR